MKKLRAKIAGRQTQRKDYKCHSSWNATMMPLRREGGRRVDGVCWTVHANGLGTQTDAHEKLYAWLSINALTQLEIEIACACCNPCKGDQKKCWRK